MSIWGNGECISTFWIKATFSWQVMYDFKVILMGLVEFLYFFIDPFFAVKTITTSLICHSYFLYVVQTFFICRHFFVSFSWLIHNWTKKMMTICITARHIFSRFLLPTRFFWWKNNRKYFKQKRNIVVPPECLKTFGGQVCILGLIRLRLYKWWWLCKDHND